MRLILVLSDILGVFLKNNSGNILFVILIAVALFAALTFAISHSTNVSQNSTVRETSTINGSVLTQYVASIRSTILRMRNDGRTIFELQFNAPADFGSLTSQSFGVFHPSGGTVIYQTAPSDLRDIQGDNPTGQWIFTYNFEVSNVGTSVAGNLNGNDLIAFQVGIKEEVCSQINQRLGLPTLPIPTITNQSYASDMITSTQSYYVDHDYVLPVSEFVIGAGAGDAALSGQLEGCYHEDQSDNYVYYGVMIER